MILVVSLKDINFRVLIISLIVLIVSLNSYKTNFVKLLPTLSTQLKIILESQFRNTVKLGLMDFIYT